MDTKQRVKLWDAINDYATACCGDPSRHVYGNTPRQSAVAEVERIARDIEAEALNSVAFNIGKQRIARHKGYPGFWCAWSEECVEDGPYIVDSFQAVVNAAIDMEEECDMPVPPRRDADVEPRP